MNKQNAPGTSQRNDRERATLHVYGHYVSHLHEDAIAVNSTLNLFCKNMVVTNYNP